MAPITKEPPDEQTPAHDGQNSRTGPSIVVGLGGAGRRIEPLERFLSAYRPDTAVATVVVLRDREESGEERLRRAVERAGLELVGAANDAPVEAGRIYLAPPDAILTLGDGRLRIRTAEELDGQRGAIDSFFLSLAAERREHAVGVVFDGSGSDGTLGVAAIKEAGGFTLAERTEHDEQFGLQTARTAAALADIRLPPEHMPEQIALYIGHLSRVAATPDSESLPATISESLSQVARILQRQTGHDFHGYKRNTFLRRVQRRMQVVRLETIEQYVALLRNDPQETQNLFNDLLISVTRFFRDAKEFALLESEVLPRLLEDKRTNGEIRVWVLGCATGEEAYSIAILLREQIDRLEIMPRVQIFATDIDGRALAAARVGRYSEAIAHDITPARLARWFVKEGNTYCVVKDLREMCVFAGHNVIRDVPFSRIDLVSCRNLLIYLNGELQDRVLPLFHFALRPGGYLFLGSSESVSRHPKLFAPIDRRHRVFRRLDTATRMLPNLPLSSRRDGPPAEPAPLPTRPRGGGLIRDAERIVESYAPAFVLIDDQHEVLHFSGRTGRFIDPTSGAASLNLLNLVHRDLRPDLRAALHRSEETGQAIHLDGVPVGAAGSRLLVDMAVEPLAPAPGRGRTSVVVFNAREMPAGGADPAQPEAQRDHQVRQLDKELRATRERLQSAIEELEMTNEELKSSNEEYQSLNEEMQSSHEELETSREELQSANEELTTVNSELAHRVLELARANNDIKNLLESTQIPTVFLDTGLRVKSHTPAATDIFHLVETDIDRPITHIKARVRYDELQDDARKVLRTLATAEREIEDPDNSTRYIARLAPYRSVDNYITGVVMTFYDVTRVVRAEAAVRETTEKLQHMAEAIPEIILVAKPDGSYCELNGNWYKFTGRRPETSLGWAWVDAVHPGDAEAVTAGWQDAVRRRARWEAEYRLRATDGRYRWFLARAQPFLDDAGNPSNWFGTLTDITDRRAAEERQSLLLAELQHRVKNMLAVIRSIARRTAESSTSVDEYAAHLDGRIDALARTQILVTRAPDGAADLEHLIVEELMSYGAREDGQASVRGPVVRLRPKAAEMLGLAVHELATNSVKYGAISQTGGRIDVSWRIDTNGEAPRLVLHWVENGVRINGAEPRRKGFGHDLIERTLSYELDASTAIEFHNGSLRCMIEVPLSDRIVVPAQQPGLERDGDPDRRPS